MDSQPNGSAVNRMAWLDLRPRLRSDLLFRPQKIAGRSVYIVEDPVRTRFYRIGQHEYLLAASLDGQSTVRAAMCRANKSLPEEPLREQDALQILNWATQNDLLESNIRGVPTQFTAPTTKPASRLQRGQNPICFRLPLGNPDPLIARCYPYFAWIYSRWATLLGLVIITLGLAAVIVGWDRMIASKDDIFSPTGQLSLFVCWIVLKIIHEFSHGLVCRRYGGTIREAGLVLILLLPIAYVDVTSSWRIRSRWQRIHIALAGMQLELYVAGIAALGWSFTSAGVFNQLCGNLVLMAGVTTLLFNANPLMRFDGYYLLTDLLEMPNLAVTAQHWLRGWARHFFLGLPVAPASWPNGRGSFIRTYAVLAFLWRIFISIGLIVAAATMWNGAGVVLAAAAVVAWIGVPLVKLLQCSGTVPTAPDWRRFATVVTAIGLIGACALSYLPWPGVKQATGIVNYDPPTALRAEVDGFVERVFVQSGQSVVAGQEIARLANAELQRDYALLQLQSKASQLRIRGLRGRRELAKLAAETEQLAALKTQLAELKSQVAGLIVRAPVAGRVVSRDIDAKIGQFLHQGDILLSLGNEHQKQVEFSIPEEELTAFSAALHTPVSVSITSGESHACRVDRVAPRATVHPLDRALCAPFGGVQPVRQPTTEFDPADQEASLELMQPHFTGNIVLSRDQSIQLKAGQRVHVLLGGRRESLGTHLWELVADWVLSRSARPTS